MEGYIVTVDGMYYKHPDITSPTPSRECLFDLAEAKKIAIFVYQYLAKAISIIIIYYMWLNRYMATLP